eukprot:25235-Prorocentrum_minimum.AAC.1
MDAVYPYGGTAIGRWMRYIPTEGLRLVDGAGAFRVSRSDAREEIGGELKCSYGGTAIGRWM